MLSQSKQNKKVVKKNARKKKRRQELHELKNRQTRFG